MRQEVWEEFVKREAGKKGEKVQNVGKVPSIEAKKLFWRMMRYVLDTGNPGRCKGPPKDMEKLNIKTPKANNSDQNLQNPRPIHVPRPPPPPHPPPRNHPRRPL